MINKSIAFIGILIIFAACGWNIWAFLGVLFGGSIWFLAFTFSEFPKDD